MVLVVHIPQPFLKEDVVCYYSHPLLSKIQVQLDHCSVFKKNQTQTFRESQQVLRDQHSSDFSLVQYFLKIWTSSQSQVPHA